MSSQNEDNGKYEFYATIIKNIKNFSQMLKAIHFQDNAVFYCTRYGVKVTVEDLKCVQANAFINAELFDEYELSKCDEDEIIKFKVNLSVILECLSIFGTSAGSVTTLKMTYQGTGFPLEILIEEDGIITNCTVKTMSPDLLLDFNFGRTNVPNKIILHSDAMKDIMHDLDMTSEIVKIFISPNAPYFRLTTLGDAGESQTDIPKDCGIVDSFQCNSVVQYSYKIIHIKPSIKPLGISNKVSIRINDRGFLCFQYMIKIDENHVSFVEYYCTPVVDDEDEL
ncbi:UNVERIFIED_CONTAM: hypothetical protein PYX00_009367 [Menopon gallinae]|uniref:Cell cycle checkpoint protein RAD1 n=1 Tax=Menopon gallinae TaxID=328185 RepID=A0AAW2HB80_9NEOP